MNPKAQNLSLRRDTTSLKEATCQYSRLTLVVWNENEKMQRSTGGGRCLLFNDCRRSKSHFWPYRMAVATKEALCVKWKAMFANRKKDTSAVQLCDVVP